jgi:Matrixin
MNKNLLVKLSFSVVLTVFGITSAWSYTLLSPRRTWDSPPAFIVDNRGLASVADGDGGVTRTVNALNSSVGWNSAGCGTLLRASAGSVASFRLGDGIPMINFRDPVGACSGSCLVATFTGYYARRADGTYRITDSDMVTNTRYDWASAGEAVCSSEFFVESVFQHEVGHALGLGHSTVAGATMYPSIPVCSASLVSIEADDKSAVRALYGCS